VRALIVRGSRNIFTVRPFPSGTEAAADSGTGAATAAGMSGRAGTGELECRIRGKVLKGVEGYYNPLAPGDWVSVIPDGDHPGKGLILSVEERKNAFVRFNQKGKAPQLLAANVDLVLCVTTPLAPPFRPRFLDRVLLQGDIAGIPPVILLNKCDLVREGADPDVEERLTEFGRLGYRVLRVSALSGQGLGELRALLRGKRAVLAGQSGVGKSSLVNALLSRSALKVGALNEKYGRGNHTTSQGTMVEIPEEGGTIGLVDTPGIRRFVPYGAGVEDLIFHLREFAPLAGTCTYGLSCSHRTEPGCKIMEAVAAGAIHEDRYESFLRIQDELAGKNGDD
jgi:ribosome biogenesis GTPase